MKFEKNQFIHSLWLSKKQSKADISSSHTETGSYAFEIMAFYSGYFDPKKLFSIDFHFTAVVFFFN